MDNLNTNNNKGMIGVVILLIVVILGLVGYIFYDKALVSKESNNDNHNANKETNINKPSDDNNDDEGNTIKGLDLSKSLNTNNISYSNSSDSVGDYGLSMNINSDKTSITLSIDWNKFGPLSTATSFAPGVENYQITGFSKNISSTFIGELGQDSKGLTLFYLMSDGTVEYTPMFNRKNDSQNNIYYEMNYTYDYSTDGRITGQHFATKGLVSGVNGVIKLYNVDASNGSSYRTTIGAKADGSFYDLGNVISK